MKKVFVACMLSMVIVMLGLTLGTAVEKHTVLKWGDPGLPPSHPNVQAAYKFAEIVKEKTNGLIEIQIFPSGQLGSNRETIEAVSQGIQDMTTDGDGPFSHFVKWVGVFGAPYIYRDEAHMEAVISGPIFQRMRQDLIDKLNIRILGGAFYYGWRYLTTTDTPVYSVEDVKGLKLRVPGGKAHLDMEKVWGAVPTPMNFPELYMALRQGVVDGQDNPLPVIQSVKFHEVQKYLIATKHMNNIRWININEDVYQTLSPEQQRIFEEAAKEVIDWNNRVSQERDQEILVDLQRKGMDLIIPDVESFRKASVKIYADWEEAWGKGVAEAIANTPS